MYFRYLVIISPWKWVGPFFEQTWIPYTQGCLVPSLVEIGLAVQEKKIFNVVNVFSRFRNYLSLEKGGAIHLNKLESPGWNWPSGSGEDFTDSRTDGQRTTGDQERWYE